MAREHIKVYKRYFGYGDQDFVPSEYSGRPGADVHHLTFRSHGGGDNIENLMALTREEHERAHNDPAFNEELKKIHAEYLDF